MSPDEAFLRSKPNHLRTAQVGVCVSANNTALLANTLIAVNAILDEIVAAMARGDRVELRDFGAFVVKVRAARVGRNPKTGAQVHVPARVTAAFKPGKEIRKRLNVDGPMGEPSQFQNPSPTLK